jgi:hypothetical protein
MTAATPPVSLLELDVDDGEAELVVLVSVSSPSVVLLISLREGHPLVSPVPVMLALTQAQELADSLAWQGSGRDDLVILM